MPTSKREQILERLVELMGEEYIQASTIVRNRALIKEDSRPAIAVLDGDERARLTGDGLGRGMRGRVAMGVQLMTMLPQVYFIPHELLPRNETRDSPPVNIGTVVNEYADLIIRVVAQDPMLQSLVGNNGSIAFLTMETDFKSGAALQGQCRLEFALTYLIDPSAPL